MRKKHFVLENEFIVHSGPELSKAKAKFDFGREDSFQALLHTFNTSEGFASLINKASSNRSYFLKMIAQFFLTVSQGSVLMSCKCPH